RKGLVSAMGLTGGSADLHPPGVKVPVGRVVCRLMGRLHHVRRFKRASRATRFLILALFVAGIGAAVAYAAIGGATPPSGTLGPASGSSTKFTFDPIVGAASGGTEEEQCAPAICSR